MPLLIAAGCKTVARENLISSVDTGIGLSLAENPNTQLDEAKAGYIRSQFYSVPTGKLVEGATNNAAATAPELVSGIRLESDARHLFLGMSVAENFAVGKVAVMSPAAVAMYVAPAKDPSRAAASAAAQAVAGVPTAAGPLEVGDLQGRAFGKLAAVAGNGPKLSSVRQWIEQTHPAWAAGPGAAAAGDYPFLSKFINAPPGPDKRQNLEALIGQLPRIFHDELG